MGKATIVSGGADGLYSVTMDYGQAARDAKVLDLTALLAALEVTLTALQAAMGVAQAAEDNQKVVVDAAIATYITVSNAVGPALAAANMAQAALAVVEADEFATPEDLAAAQATLLAANDAYTAAKSAIDPALKAYTEAAALLAKLKGDSAQARLPLELMKARKVQLTKDRATWAALVLTETVPAWCADFTEEATGLVATVEVPGENKLVLIAPAAPAPTATDGLLTAREVQSPAQVFWNAAALPGWQKHKPTYRRGTITALNAAADTADVALDNDVSSAQSLVINQTPTLANVPVVYMACHAAAFEVGDKCVVKFTNQDWAQPKVVGFVDHPKACASYEFFSSEPVHRLIFSTRRTYTGDAFVGGSAVRAFPFGTTALPLFSTALTPNPETPKWALRAEDYKLAPSQYSDKLQFRSWAAWQNQKFFEYINWPANGRSSMVSSTQAQAPGLNSQCNWTANFTDTFVSSGLFVNDNLIDVPPTYYSASGSKTGEPVFENNRVWPRHAAVQSAGGRLFFICSDNYGRFQIYPVKDYPAVDYLNYFPVETYYTLTPPYPAWVTLPNVGSTNVVSNQWLWAFNKDATKAVSCPFNSAASGGSVHKDPDSHEQMDFAKDFGATSPDGALTISGRHDTPGLVEFGIVITVTGDGDFDFSVECTLLRNHYAATGGRFFFDAAYSLADKGLNNLLPYPEDTLVTAEVEVWVRPGDYVAGPVTVPAIGDVVHSATTPAGYVVLCSNDEALTRTEVLRLPALTPSRRFLNTTLLATTSPAASSYKTEWAYIHALELRTMSVHYILNSTKTGLATNTLMAYNEVIETWSDTFYGIDPGAELAPLCTEQVPIAAIPHYQLAVFFSMRTDWGRGFNIHPAGHWSHCRTTSETLDIVQPAGGERTSHKALFNMAFEQTRDYSYYANPAAPAGPDTPENLVERFDAAYGYLGGFRTNGVWMTF